MNPKRLFSALMVVMSVATTAAASDAIERKYKDVGAATLGKPAGAEKSSAGGGRVRLYANGGIWSSKTAGTHAVYGPAFDKYKSLRAERGELGYPVTDVAKLPDGSAQALFRHGYIVVDASGAVRSEVIPKATFTADSITLKGVKAKMTPRNEAFVEPLPQSGPGSTFACSCVTKKDEPGTGSCDIQLKGNIIRCAANGCRNNCRLLSVPGRPP